MALLAVILFSWASRANVKDFPELTTLGQTTVCMTGSCLVMCLIYIGMVIMNPIDGLSVLEMSVVELCQLFIYGILGMAISQFFWLLGIKQIGLGLASFHINTVSFYVMLIMFALGQAWNGLHLLGAVLVGLGIVISQSSKKSFLP